MYDLAGLTPAISETGYVYACPNAPVAMDVGGGQVGFGWTPPDGFNDPEWIQRGEDLLDRSVGEIFTATKGAPGKTVLLGFSQGGGLAYRYGLPRPDVFAGVVALSTGFPSNDGFVETLPADRGQPCSSGTAPRTRSSRSNPAVRAGRGSRSLATRPLTTSTRSGMRSASRRSPTSSHGCGTSSRPPAAA